jgi:hypothetical protein
MRARIGGRDYRRVSQDRTIRRPGVGQIENRSVRWAGDRRGSRCAGRRAGDRGEEHPGLPTPGGFILSFLGIAAAGLLGGAIGFGIENVNSRGDGGALLALAALVGSVVAALGTAVVAVVGLRARSQWRPRPIGVSVPVSRRR